VLRRKIERSQRLLSQQSLSVTSIAHSLGFSSSQHFASAFKRYVGVSPTAYRDQRLVPDENR
jgi:AraC-like DNA-binding protein